MRIADFGRFDGQLVLCGGAYSNLQALEALAGVADDRPVICTGDVVAYGADAAATVALVRELGWPVVAGNCERQIAAGADDCGCGFGVGSTCAALSQGWYPHALAACDKDVRTWMASLPDIGVIVHQNRRYGVIHGGATANNRFLWPSSGEAEFSREISTIEETLGPIDGVIAGHSGIAFQRQIGQHQWINAGVIGLPPHDGRPETRYAVLEGGDAIIHRLAYDHATARAAMETAGLTQGYHDTLTSGIWPSEDTLPRELRR